MESMDSLQIVLLVMLLIAVGVGVYLNYRRELLKAELPAMVQSGIEQWRTRFEEEIARRERGRYDEWRQHEAAALLAGAQREALVSAHRQFQLWCEHELSKVRREQQEMATREADRQLAEWKAEQEKSIRQDAIQRSQAVTTGKVTEHLVPHLPDFQFNPRDARFIGSPVDFVIFDGLNDDAANRVNEVVFLEVKTGVSTLSRRERLVREAIRAGRVRWVEWRSNKVMPESKPGVFE